MVENIETGYIGIAQFGSRNVRCTDFNVNVDQEFGFYNHVIGLNDTIPSNAATKGESVGNIQTQRTFVKPDPLTIQGSMSFPATENNLQYFFDLIKYGEYIDTFNFQYSCEEGRKFKDSRLTNFTFDISAGDIATVTIGFMAKEVEDFDPFQGVLPPYPTPEKIVTWDKVSVTVNDTNFSSNDLLKNFSLEVNNNVSPIYTLNPSNGMSELAPHDLRVGTQEVSGVITFYNRDGLVVLPDCTTPATASVINLNVGVVLSTNIKVLLLPEKTNGSIGAITSTIGYFGVDKAFGS